PCAAACPADAITLNGDTGAYIVDAELCISCGDCVEACPWGAISLHPETDIAFKCDLCGGKPKCIEVCNYGVISITKERGETEGEPEKRRFAIAERIAEGWKESVLQRE
ncbi:MAG: 4Fe-4S dicluster domain-containing protein, partial [Candidatus Thorarchaeota archaeon]